MVDKIAEDASRKEFEEWLQGTSGWKATRARGKPMSLSTHIGGSYADYRVNDRWLAWRASRTALQRVTGGV